MTHGLSTGTMYKLTSPHSMKKVRIFLALSAAGLLIPSSIAFAKTSMTLQKLSTIVQNNARPIEFNATVGGTYEDYSLKATVKGVQNAVDGTNPIEVDFSGVVSVDVSQQGSVSILFEGRVVEGNFYVRVNDITVINASSLGIEPYDYKDLLHVWIRFPLDTSMQEQLSQEGRTQRSKAVKRYERFIDITETVQRDGMRHYALSISPANQRRLLTALSAQTRRYSSPKFGAEARKNIRNTTMTLNAFVDVLSDGRFDASQIQMAIMSKLNGKKAGFNVSGTSKTISKPLIVAPEGSKLLEELMGSLSTMQLSDARNAQRRADVNTILNGVYQYAIDNNGKLPPEISMTETEICRSDIKVDCTGLVDLKLLNEMYLVSTPRDPQASTATSTKYTIFKNNDGRITVSAPSTEGDKKISVTR